MVSPNQHNPQYESVSDILARHQRNAPTLYINGISETGLIDLHAFEQRIATTTEQYTNAQQVLKTASENYAQALDAAVTDHINKKITESGSTLTGQAHYQNAQAEAIVHAIDKDKYHPALENLSLEQKTKLKAELQKPVSVLSSTSYNANIPDANKLYQRFLITTENLIDMEYTDYSRKAHIGLVDKTASMMNGLIPSEIQQDSRYQQAYTPWSEAWDEELRLKRELKALNEALPFIEPHNIATAEHQTKTQQLEALEAKSKAVTHRTTEHPELQAEITKRTKEAVRPYEEVLSNRKQALGNSIDDAWVHNATALETEGFKDLAKHTRNSRNIGLAAGGAMAILGTGLTLWQLSESGKAEQASKERQAKLAELRKMDVQA